MLRTPCKTFDRHPCDGETVLRTDDHDRGSIDGDLSPCVLFDQPADPTVRADDTSSNPSLLIRPFPDEALEIDELEVVLILEQEDRTFGCHPPSDGLDDIGELHRLDGIEGAGFTPLHHDIPRFGIDVQSLRTGCLEQPLPRLPIAPDQHTNAILRDLRHCLHGVGPEPLYFNPTSVPMVNLDAVRSCPC